MAKDNTKDIIVNKLSIVGIVGNIVLCAFKLIAGIVGKSSAMVSDAIHSLSDVVATFIAFIGVKLSEKKPDVEHQYGHEKIECFASLVLGAVLLATALGIGISAIQRIYIGDKEPYSIPTILPLIAAITSIIVKECMYRYTMHYAIIINSDAFKADAWHHRSDAFSSIGSLAGIIASRMGYPIMDSVASLIICIFIVKVAIDILKDAFSKLIDSSCGEQYETKLYDFIISSESVKNIDLLQTRMFGNKCYIDVEIAVDSKMSLIEAHDIAEDIHDRIEHEFPEVKHVMIHVNPYFE